MGQVSKQLPIAVGHPSRLGRDLEIAILHLFECAEFVVKKPGYLLRKTSPLVSGL